MCCLSSQRLCMPWLYVLLCWVCGWLAFACFCELLASASLLAAANLLASASLLAFACFCLLLLAFACFACFACCACFACVCLLPFVFARFFSRELAFACFCSLCLIALLAEQKRFDWVERQRGMRHAKARFVVLLGVVGGLAFAPPGASWRVAPDEE